MPRGGLCAYNVHPRSSAATAIVVVLARPRSPIAIAISARCSTARRIEVCSGAVSRLRSLQPAPELAQRRRRCAGSGRTSRRSRRLERAGCVRLTSPSAPAVPGPPGARPSARRPTNPRRASARTAPSRGTSSAGVPTTSTISAPTNQPTGQAQQRAGGHHRADDEMDRHEGQQQRPPPPPPAGGQPRARHREHGGEHRDPARVVEELRQKVVEPVGQSKCHRGAAMPLPVIDSASTAMSAGGGVRAEQLPLPARRSARSGSRTADARIATP